MTVSNHTAVEEPGPAVRRRKRPGAAVPDDFASALAREPRAAAFFEKLSAEHRRGVLCPLQAVRSKNTRSKRIAMIVAILARRERR